MLQRHLGDKALRAIGRDGALLSLPGETRIMTFLVCRIRGFAEIVRAFAKDPEGLSRLTRRTLTPLVKAVHDRGGTVDRMTPGGLTAFFNAPLSDPDHAIHACECALAMLQAMEKVNQVLEQGRHPDGTPFDTIGLGIGINTGTGITGNFGTDDEPDYAAVGAAFDAAEELEKLSANYGSAILAGAETRSQAERSFAFLEVDVLPAREGDGLPLFALLGSPLSRANPKFLALKTYHEHIFLAYRSREWEKARHLITQCRELSGANPVLYDLYAERIAYYEAHPPAANWNGIFETLEA
jgi:adenylate cyclase